MTIANLFARIGLKTDGDKIENFSKSLTGVKVGLVAAAGLATAFTAALKTITDEAFKSAVALKQFHAETGANTDELQRWQSVADKSNLSADAVASSIRAIVDNQQKIKLGQGNISGYQLLGINPQQDPFKILEDLRQKTQGLSQGMKKNVMEQLGVNKELIQILDMTNSEFAEMSAQAYVIKPENIDLMAKANSSVKSVNQSLTNFKNQIAIELAPQLIKINKFIVEWIKNNEQGLVRTIKDVFNWITRLVGVVINAAKMLDLIVRHTIGWKAAMMGLVAVIAILNSALLLSPIGLIIAGIVLLIAVLDDLYVYNKGSGRSLFGELMKSFPELKKIFDGLFGSISKFWEILKGLWNGTDIDKYLEKLNTLEGIIYSVLVEPLKQVTNALQLVLDLISGKNFGDSFKKFFEGYSEGGARIGKALPVVGAISNWIDRTTGTGSYSKEAAIQQAISININGAFDPQETANRVKTAIEKHTASAYAAIGVPRGKVKNE